MFYSTLLIALILLIPINLSKVGSSLVLWETGYETGTFSRWIENGILGYGPVVGSFSISTSPNYYGNYSTNTSITSSSQNNYIVAAVKGPQKLDNFSAYFMVHFYLNSSGLNLGINSSVWVMELNTYNQHKGITDMGAGFKIAKNYLGNYVFVFCVDEESITFTSGGITTNSWYSLEVHWKIGWVQRAYGYPYYDAYCTGDGWINDTYAGGIIDIPDPRMESSYMNSEYQYPTIGLWGYNDTTAISASASWDDCIVALDYIPSTSTVDDNASTLGVLSSPITIRSGVRGFASSSETGQVQIGNWVYFFYPIYEGNTSNYYLYYRAIKVDGSLTTESRAHNFSMYGVSYVWQGLSSYTVTKDGSNIILAMSIYNVTTDSSVHIKYGSASNGIITWTRFTYLPDDESNPNYGARWLVLDEYGDHLTNCVFTSTNYMAYLYETTNDWATYSVIKVINTWNAGYFTNAIMVDQAISNGVGMYESRTAYSVAWTNYYYSSINASFLLLDWSSSFDGINKNEYSYCYNDFLWGIYVHDKNYAYNSPYQYWCYYTGPIGKTLTLDNGTEISYYNSFSGDMTRGSDTANTTELSLVKVTDNMMDLAYFKQNSTTGAWNLGIDQIFLNGYPLGFPLVSYETNWIGAVNETLQPTNLGVDRYVEGASRINFAYLTLNTSILGGPNTYELKYVYIQVGAYLTDSYIDFGVDTDLGWVFCEYRYYAFIINTTITGNEEINMAGMKFSDVMNQTVEIYYWSYNLSIAPTEQSLSYCVSKSYGNDTSSLTYYDSGVKKTIHIFYFYVFLKKTLFDSFDVTLQTMLNTTSGYDTGWQNASETFNIYSSGGLYEFSGSTGGGISQGQDYFNLYSFTNNYAMSKVYWRNIVHFKLLCSLWWENQPIWPIGANFTVPTWKFGFQYYAHGQWCLGHWLSISLTDFVFGADDQWAHFIAKLDNSWGTIWTGDFYAFYDSEQNTVPIWIDFWYSRANSSSMIGCRLGAFYYGMHNGNPWWTRAIVGNNWGIYNKNMSTLIAYCPLFGENQSELHSNEIRLTRVWARVEQGSTEYTGYSNITNIQQLLYTYNSDGLGIDTPTLEEPKVPTMPPGGFLSVIAGWLAWIWNGLSPAFAYAWSGVAYVLDQILQFITGQPNVFTNFSSMVVSVISGVVSFMTIVATYFVSFFTVTSSTIYWFFTNFFTVLWGMVSFLLLTPAFNIFTIFGTILGVSYAWLAGTTYTNGWGQVYDFSHLAGFHFLGMSGGIVVFMVLFVIGFFIQILKCFTTMSLDPILAPVGLFWSLVSAIMKVMEMVYNFVIAIVRTLVAIAHALRDIAPRPGGV